VGLGVEGDGYRHAGVLGDASLAVRRRRGRRDPRFGSATGRVRTPANKAPGGHAEIANLSL
jgi:hypothetical protein